MVEKSVIDAVRHYLHVLQQAGVPIKFGVLFGSYARQTPHEWSDIDLLVISPQYDETYSREDINLLWRTAAHTDSRIEPIPIGWQRWQFDDSSTIIEIARREGIQVTLQHEL